MCPVPLHHLSKQYTAYHSAVLCDICSPTGINLGGNCGMRLLNGSFQIIGLRHGPLMVQSAHVL